MSDNDNFAEDMLWDIVRVGCSSGYPDTENEIQSLTGIMYTGSTFCENLEPMGLAIKDIHDFADDATPDQIDQLITIRGKVLSWALSVSPAIAGLAQTDYTDIAQYQGVEIPEPVGEQGGQYVGDAVDGALVTPITQADINRLTAQVATAESYAEIVEAASDPTISMAESLLILGQEFDSDFERTIRRNWMVERLEEVGVDTEGLSYTELAQSMKDNVYGPALQRLANHTCNVPAPFQSNREKTAVCEEISDAIYNLQSYTLGELNAIAARAQTAFSVSPNDNYSVLHEYYGVVEEAQLTAILESWDKEAERQQLDHLLALISAMPSTILGTSVDWVIQGVSQYYGQMEARHQALSEMVRPQEEAALLQAQQDGNARTYYLGVLMQASEDGWIDTTAADWADYSLVELRNSAIAALNAQGETYLLREAEIEIYDRDTLVQARQIASAAMLILSFVPVIGTAVDIADALLASQRGDYLGAALSFMGPIGDAANKMRRLRAVGDVAEGVLRNADETAANLVQEHGNALSTLDDRILDQMNEVADEIDELANRPSGMSSIPSGDDVPDDVIDELRANTSDVNVALINLQQNSLNQLTEADVRATRQYMFDSRFTKSVDRDKFEAWQRIVNGNPTSLDMALFIHELEELKALRQYLNDRSVPLPKYLIANAITDPELVQEFIDNLPKMLMTVSDYTQNTTSSMRRRLREHYIGFYRGINDSSQINAGGNSFTTLRLNPGHSQALMAEFEYIANQIYLWTGVKIDAERVAASSLGTVVNEGSRGYEARQYMYIRNGNATGNQSFIRLIEHPDYNTTLQYSNPLTLNNNIPSGSNLIPGQEVMIYEIIDTFFNLNQN